MQTSLRTQSVAAELLGDYYVVVMTAEHPTDDAWNKCIAIERSIPSERVRVLVWTDGGAPNAKQRAQLKAAHRGAQPLTSVITPSKLARTIGIAITWFNPNQRMFSPSEVESALDHLGVQGANRQRLLDAAARLRKELAVKMVGPTGT